MWLFYFTFIYLNLINTLHFSLSENENSNIILDINFEYSTLFQNYLKNMEKGIINVYTFSNVNNITKDNIESFIKKSISIENMLSWSPT